jgi:nucleoside-triphosphatase THEP1
LTGPVHSGKTTLLKNSIPILRNQDFTIDGYLTESVWKNNECIGYELIDLKEHRVHPFLSRNGEEEWEKIGPYFFLPESLAIAKKIIRRARGSDLAVVDEVGPLELAGKGVWPALAEALSSHPDFFLVIRESILAEFLSLLKRYEVLVLTVSDRMPPSELAASLRAEIEKRRKSRSL